MKRIGVTQRVEIVADYGERRDCLDQNWCRLLDAAGLFAMPLPNLSLGDAHSFDQLGLDGVVLSGGNDPVVAPGAANTAPERDSIEQRLIDYCLSRRLPVLGVCRGFMMINLHLGGEIEMIEGHRAVRHSVKILPNAAAFWSQQREVNSFHNYAVRLNGLASSLEPLAVAEDGSIEAFLHNQKLCAGIMWHPEREAPFAECDVTFLKRFFSPLVNQMQSTQQSKRALIG